MSPSRDAHALLALGRLEVLGEDVLTGLEPRDPAQPRNVEQHAAPHEPVLEDFDRVDIGTCSVIASSGRSL